MDRPNELVVEQTPFGSYAFTRRQLWFRPQRGVAWQPVHLGSQLAAGYNRVRFNRDGVLRLANAGRLLARSSPAQRLQPRRSLIRRGMALEDRVLQEALAFHLKEEGAMAEPDHLQLGRGLGEGPAAFEVRAGISADAGIS